MIAHKFRQTWQGVVFVVVATVITSCSQTLLNNYDYYRALSPSDIQAQFADTGEQSDRVTSPLLQELIEYEQKQPLQSLSLVGVYNTEQSALNLTAQVAITYSQKLKELDDKPIYFDRARVNSGFLWVLEAEPAAKSCVKKTCEFKLQLSVPFTVQTLLNSRYSGLVIELIKPGHTPMIVRLPDTYVRAFSNQIETLLEQRFTSYKRITDAHARPVVASSRDQLHVEDMAKSVGCPRTGVRPLMYEGPKSAFQIECEGNTYRSVSCEWGTCEFLQDENQ